MPSGSSSRDVSTRTAIALGIAFAAAFAAVTPAFAQSDLEFRRSDFATPLLVAFAQPGADSSAVAPRAEPAPASAEPAAPPAVPAPVSVQPPAGAPHSRAVANPRKALMLSLLLPGVGELYSGHKGRATGFFISEGAIWANFVAWEISGRLRRDNYIEQAQINAGLGTSSES